MNLLISVDGGQSSTLALVARPDGTILGTGLAGPSNHVLEPGGMERLRTALDDSITRALTEAGAEAGEVSSVFLGMTGGAATAREMTQPRFPGARVESDYDQITALYGASVAQPGVVVIAGTGAVAYGRDAAGRSAKAGGWGYVMGDEGSGYDIGRRALLAATQAADGRRDPGLLQQMIPQSLGVADLWAVHARVYAGQLDRAGIARLTVLVDQAGQAGDAAALEILSGAGEHLARAAWAVMQRLDAPTLPTFTAGGVFQSTILRHAFIHALGQLAPESVAHEPAFPPVIGGLLLAMQGVGIDITSAIVERIRATFPQSAFAKHQARESSGE